MTQFIFESNPVLLPLVMVVVLGLAVELPYRLRHLLSGKKAIMDSVTAVLAGLLTLSAFVLSLSFSQAAARFDARRSIVVNEANSIGTTWLRADQLQPEETRRFRRILVDDTAGRLAAYQSPAKSELYRQMLARTAKDEDQMWSIASSALRKHQGSLGLSLFMQSLNETIDIIAAQRQALASHVPTAIIVLTLFLVVLGALSLGIRFALDDARPATLSAIYVVAYVIVITMMVDYDRPNSGWVRVSLTPLTSQLAAMRGRP